MRVSRGNAVLIVIAVLLLLPVVLAAIAPLLAPIPAQATSWTAPPLPDREESLPGFQHLLEPLPIVVRDLPDAESRDVVSIYDAATLTDNAAAWAMVEAANKAIPVPPAQRTDWDYWVQSGQGDSPPRTILASLQGDPQNGDRLNNLAVAIYFSAKTRNSEGGYSTNRQSWRLLQATLEVFPETRSAFLNNAFLSDDYLVSGHSPNDPPVDFAGWLNEHQEDPTALTLAVEIVVNHARGFNLDAATLSEYATTLSLSSDAAHAALGHALLGDLQMAEFRFGNPAPSSEVAPYEFQRAAHLALEHYDSALQLSDDPSLYAARALMLSIIGDIPAAIRSQQRAVDLQPDSLPLALQLASHFLDLRGSVDDMRRSVASAREIEREAVARTLGREGIPLADVRFLADSRHLIPLAANRPATFFAIYLPGMAGAGYGISFTEIPLYSRRPEGSFGNNPLTRAVGGIVAKSQALGDVDSIDDDVAAYLAVISGSNSIVFPAYIVPDSGEEAVATARLVADGESASSADLAIGDVDMAAEWLRFMGDNEKAMKLCQHANTQAEEGSGLQFNMLRCTGDNAYLVGDYETAQQAFEALGDQFMAGYVAHRRGDLGEAERLLKAARESQPQHQYDALQRLGDIFLESGQPSRAVQSYDEWLAWAEPGDCYDGVCQSCVRDMCIVLNAPLPFVYSNRGVAVLQTAADREGTIDCSGEARDACSAALADFNSALEFDAYNPVFLMNKAWVTRLLGDPDSSELLMQQALDSDHTLYPVLNDLGVQAVGSGNRTAARDYFLDAAAANPHYDLALWNLGVLKMQEGIGGILRGQAYLARAIVRNPSLVTDSMDFRTDERFYRVEITESLRPGSGWSFGAASSIATTTFGFITMALVLLQAFYAVGLNKAQDTLSSLAESGSRWFRRFNPRHLLPQESWPLLRLLPLTAGLATLALVTVLTARQGDPHAAAASAALALFAVVLAVIVHELGHAFMARRVGAIVQPAQWTPGLVLAFVLLPTPLGVSPFPGQRVVSDEEKASWKVYVAGPLANLGFAAVVYILFMLQPLPMLRLIAQVQLAAMGYALLPFEPLDGAALARRHPAALGALGTIALLMGVLFSVGIL